MDNSSWVHKGMEYIEENSSVCPFCQHNTIDEIFRNKLNDFFNNEYIEKLDYMKLKKKELFNEVYSILDGLRNNLEMQESCNIAELNISTYNALIGKIEAQLESVNNKIEKKIKAQKIKFFELVESFNEINDLLFSYNDKIKKNNNLVNEYNNEYKKLVDDVWCYCIYDSANLIKLYEKNMNSINKALKGMKKTSE